MIIFLQRNKVDNDEITRHKPKSKNNITHHYRAPTPKRITRTGCRLDNKTNHSMFSNASPEIPSNLRLAMLGDSLMRYQYIDLVYFLKSFGDSIHNTTGTKLNEGKSWWRNTSLTPPIEYGDAPSKYYSSWDVYYNYTNSLLQPYERCDCYRWIPQNRENRYYYDPRTFTNNVIYYINKGGINPVQSYWTPQTIWDDHGPMHRQGHKTNPSDWPHKHIFNWAEVINDFISQLVPKPNIIILNAGFWEHNLHDPKIRTKIIQSIKEQGMISIYKTTSKTTKLNETSMRDYETEMCRLADYCFDLTWTFNITADCLYDDKHFISPIYSWMNIAFFHLLQQIKEEHDLGI